MCNPYFLQSCTQLEELGEWEESQMGYFPLQKWIHWDDENADKMCNIWASTEKGEEIKCSRWRLEEWGMVEDVEAWCGQIGVRLGEF